MSEDASTLYAKLLGETAAVSWTDIQTFFARGTLLRVGSEHDLLTVAQAVALDDRAKVAVWLENGTIGLLAAEQAQDWAARDPCLWAVVVKPWILVQERAERDQAH